MLNGSLTLNSATYHAPPEGYQDTISGDIFGVAALPIDPTNREFIEGEQTLINGTRWIAKLSGLYELPWGINVAGTLNAREGFPFIPNILSPNRPNGLGTHPRDGRAVRDAAATTTSRWLDFKAEKRFTIDKVTVNASVDVFNLDQREHRVEPRDDAELGDGESGDGSDGAAGAAVRIAIHVLDHGVTSTESV